MMLFSMLTSVAIAQALPAVAQPTAFFCLVGEYDTDKKQMISPKPISLNFLLAGHPLDVDGKSPQKTSDPNKLLNGESFNYFAKNDRANAKGYIAMTQGLSSKSGYLLTMVPNAEKDGAYDVVLGAKGSSGRRHVGQCFGPVAPIDEATFDQESKQ